MESDATEDTDTAIDVDLEETSQQDDQEITTSDPNTEKPSLKRSTALFLLKTKEINRVTQTALNHIIEGVTDLFQAYSSTENSSVNPFAGLETQYLQEKFYTEEFNLVVSTIN